MVEIDIIIERLERELNHIYRIRAIEDASDNLMINCPYHDDRSPSFGILKEDKRSGKKLIRAGHGHCFACGASASFAAVISRMFGHEGDEFGAAWLLEHFNIDSEAAISFYKTNYVVDAPKIIDYEKYVTYHPYIKKRGISESIAQAFSLGYNPARDSITMPVFDKFGVCRMIVERTVTGKGFHNTKGADKTMLLFGLDMYYRNISNLSHIKTVYVVESAIDALLLWQQGKVAVALLQAKPFPEHIKLIDSMFIDNIVMATDNDEAGDMALKEFMEQSSKNIYRVVFPPGTKDIGDFTPEQIRGIEIVERKKRRVVSTLFKNPF